jgi:hypothetical protein
VPKDRVRRFLPLAPIRGIYQLAALPSDYHSGDAITFKDGKTRSTVTLQNFEVTEITKDQYGASTGAR